jgi:phage terminase small subunit
MNEAQETSPKKLTAKQRAFVNEYIVDLHATNAALRAGYSSDSAYSIGSENLTKPEIADAIQEALDLRSERTRITADRVLVEVAKLGFSNIKSIFTEGGQLRNLNSLPDEVAAAIQSVEVVTKRVEGGEDHEVEYVHKIKMADKKASLELLGKHLKLFADRTELTGADGKDLIPEMSDTEIARTLAFLLAKGANAQEKP